MYFHPRVLHPAQKEQIAKAFGELADILIDGVDRQRDVRVEAIKDFCNAQEGNIRALVKTTDSAQLLRWRVARSARASLEMWRISARSSKNRSRCSASGHRTIRTLRRCDRLGTVAIGGPSPAFANWQYWRSAGQATETDARLTLGTIFIGAPELEFWNERASDPDGCVLQRSGPNHACDFQRVQSRALLEPREYRAASEAREARVRSRRARPLPLVAGVARHGELPVDRLARGESQQC